ncbi:MAG: dTMP kinase [Candidatus Bathyarchaeota archaeon]|nr:dTMP kinase [Candidatus Bathyarchaeota archaeon]
MPKGCFIVFEGTDGSGKSTQFQMLYDKLKKFKYQVTKTKEPTHRPIGYLIRNILYENGLGIPEESLALLFAADRIDHIKSVIRPALKEGSIVISDRYVYSSYAYQSKGMQKELDLSWLEQINRFSFPPDIVVFLDISPEEGLDRGNKRVQDHTYFSSLIQQQRIRSIYYKIFNLDKKTLYLDDFEKKSHKKSKDMQIVKMKNTTILKIDAMLSMNKIHELILDYVVKFLENKGISKIDKKDVKPKSLTSFS